MNMYMLDSSAWVEYFSGTEKGRNVRDIVEKGEVSTCILAIAELSDKCHRENTGFDKLLDFILGLSSIKNITVEICSEAGKLKAERRKTKKDFSLADAVIYLTAEKNSCILITGDDDFSGMKDVVFL